MRFLLFILALTILAGLAACGSQVQSRESAATEIDGFLKQRNYKNLWEKMCPTVWGSFALQLDHLKNNPTMARIVMKKYNMLHTVIRKGDAKGFFRKVMFNDSKRVIAWYDGEESSESHLKKVEGRWCLPAEN